MIFVAIVRKSGLTRFGFCPRMRRKKFFQPPFEPVTQGSPPHARGKDKIFFLCLPPRGITPACAGKSASKPSSSAASRDHPRVRGEKSLKSSSMMPAQGSPPRARGKAGFRHARGQQPGITPACAGKRTSTMRAGFSPGDHPRVCGEKESASAEATHGQGSPPRVRGKVKARIHRAAARGITPARAGKSNGVCRYQRHDRDHPRACGEKLS